VPGYGAGGALLEIVVDTQRCMGSGNCAFHAPGTFDLDEDAGHAVVVDPDGSSEDQVILAAEGCPVGAIAVIRDGVRIDKGRP
jgi:ferredoxin